MTDRFLNDDFLLTTGTARRLYHEHAAETAIYDFHSHLPAESIAADVSYGNLAEVWLGGDHYKWRAMRTCGVPERLCTGLASPEERFRAWAATVPKLVGNPLYVWTHLELRRYFGVNERLSPESADGIYRRCSELLASPEFSTRQLLRRMRVEVVFTTDDPVHDLASHAKLRTGGFDVRIVPTFRPDRALATADPAAYAAYLDQLGAASGTDIVGYHDLIDALRRRHAFFHAAGCRASDHGLEAPFAGAFTESAAATAFARVRAGQRLSSQEQQLLATALLVEVGRMDHERGWVQQLHVGALRNPNSRRFAEIGPDAGFDAIGDPAMSGLARYLDLLERERHLPKTVLYNLNPAVNELCAALAGSFQDGVVPGKIQFGSAWWFMDQRDGMERQLRALASIGVLGQFIGMVTDSRSFLSYPRHELFRRTLCKVLGELVALGEAPEDPALLGGLVRDVCRTNAAAYFALPPG